MVNAVAVLDQTRVDRTDAKLAPQGNVTFSQEGNRKTHVHGSFSRLSPGFHVLVVHEFGDIRDGWKSTGPPFKLAGIAGVITVFVAGPDGKAEIDLWTKADLSGENSVMRRGLVVHGVRCAIPGLNVSSGSIPGPEVDLEKYLGTGEAWAVIGLAR